MATRRAASSRQAKPVSSATISTDKLAEQLASGLNISNVQGKKKAARAVLSDEEVRISAMSSVNSASQALSAVIQSGWKFSTSAPTSKETLRSATTSAASVAKHLAVLRRMCPGDIDVERAAVSVLGKLVTLEMFDEAASALEDLHPQLCSFYNTAPSVSQPTIKKLHLLSISLPSLSDQSQDTILLTLTSTYLTYALNILSSACFTPQQKTNDVSPFIDSLSDVLYAESTLLTWIPALSSLPIKQLDSKLTHAYTALTRLCATYKSHSRAIFLIRMYAMLCLAYTSTGTVEPNTFWDQITRFGSAFVKACGSEEELTTRTVLSSFDDLINRVEKRTDRQTFMTGKGFVRFSEYWMALAKKAGDICTLDRIGGVIQGTSLPSHNTDKAQMTDQTSRQYLPMEKKVNLDSSSITLEGTKVCTALAQLTIILEKNGTDLSKRIQETITLLRNSDLMVRLLQAHEDLDEDTRRINGKVDRALERMRKSAIGSLTTSASILTSGDHLLELVKEILHVLKSSLSYKPDPDKISRCLDTIFTLARIILKPTDPRTYPPAHEYLVEGVAIIETLPPDVPVDTANFIRCISGAFHNLAGTIYQAGRHGAAIGFLKDACALGVKALDIRGTGTVNERVEEGWKQLEEQLYRRWELLGICYSKIGDRKQAFDALLQSITTFPYSKSGFSEKADESALDVLFESSNANKQLGTLVDRMTYLGACELLMEHNALSLVSLRVNNPVIVGALLERQVESLENQQYKDGIQVITAHLLFDALKIYTHDMPIRRARVLLKCMEFAYYTGPEVVASIGSPVEIGNEAEHLLASKTFNRDMGLVPFRTQYQVSIHLWLALHIHRRVDVEQSTLIVRHLDEAYGLLKTLVTVTPSEQNAGRKISPKQVVASKKPTLVPPARTARTAISKKTKIRDPVTPKPKSRKGLQVISLHLVTPPKQANASIHPLIFKDIGKLLSLLQLVARISGLLALTLSKVHILDIIRKLCDRQMDALSDSYVMASAELAHEYVKLGKTQRAAAIFSQALTAVKSGKASDEVCILFFLRLAESLAAANDVGRSVRIYCEALALSKSFEIGGKNVSTTQQIQTRVRRLEKAAIASHVFALIQYSKEDVTASLDGMLQSLRLWNRAVDTLARLNPPSTPTVDSNPFHMGNLKDAEPSKVSSQKSFIRRPALNGLEWRISEGLLATLFALSHAYMIRGSVREAEYFAQQAQDLAESLNAPTMVSRALAKKGEIQLYQGLLNDSHESLTKAGELLQSAPGVDNVDIHRLRGIYNERTSHHGDAQEVYEEAIEMIEELDQIFKNFDGFAFGRKSLDTSSNTTTKPPKDIALPVLFAAVLRQHIWLLRDNDAEDYTNFLNKLLSLPYSYHSKAEENALMAKLTLHGVYGRFRSDMFLSSLAESTIALPMGMSRKTELTLPLPTQDILGTLDDAEKLYWSNLSLVARKGRVPDVRDIMISLALVQTFQTSLGKPGENGARLAANLLDTSTSITLRREMLEAIQHKFSSQIGDDLQWPLVDEYGTPLPHPEPSTIPGFSLEGTSNVEDDEGLNNCEGFLKDYWDLIRRRCQTRLFEPTTFSSSQTTGLPSSWTIIHMNVTEDKSTLFITRQEGGEMARDPLIFCIPLKGRRDNGSGEDEEHLTFDDALEEFKNIVRLSDEGTKAAAHIKDDQNARANWWHQRNELNTRMQELLENIEFCWLGAFKTILSPRPNLTPELISDLRLQFERVFQRNLHMQDKKSKARSGNHKKNPSLSQNQTLSQVTFDDALLECFSTLSPKCRDEELEDLVYFILDLYQFHGVPVAISEVDIVQVVVDLRGVLEDHASKLLRRKPRKGHENLMTDSNDEHTFLILDRNLQGLPWESIPILKGRNVSRIPSIDFLHDRISFAKWKRESKEGSGSTTEADGSAVVDPTKGYYILNPSGDLGRTEDRFKVWTAEMEKVGWQGTTGHAPSEQQFLNALRDQDLVVYFGHGGGEQYLRSHKIRHLPTCAVTMLWGCSSGALRDMGDFDPVGTPYNYMLAGCPTLVANLWDVTDRDIDKFSQSVFNKMHLTAEGITDWVKGKRTKKVSIAEAVAQSRDSCKLEYLTGAAPVVYGIPFYL